MIYTGIIYKTKSDIEYIEKCLNNVNNGHKEDFMQIGEYTFSNGITIYFDLCSGTENYYLQYVLVDKDNNEVDSDVIDDLKDFEISDNKNTYRVYFVIENE